MDSGGGAATREAGLRRSVHPRTSSPRRAAFRLGPQFLCAGAQVCDLCDGRRKEDRAALWRRQAHQKGEPSLRVSPAQASTIGAQFQARTARCSAYLRKMCSAWPCTYQQEAVRKTAPCHTPVAP